MRKILLLACVSALLVSCSTQKNLTKLVQALSKDPATVRISYGPLIFERFVPLPNQAAGYVPMPAQWGAPFVMPQVTPLVPAQGVFWTPATNNVVK